MTQPSPLDLRTNRRTFLQPEGSPDPRRRTGREEGQRRHLCAAQRVAARSVEGHHPIWLDGLDDRARAGQPERPGGGHRHQH